MLYPDLVARTCGFMGVFGALITLGFMGNPDFLITPQPSYAPLEIQISVKTEVAATNELPQQAPESESTPEQAPQLPSEPEVAESLPEAAKQEKVVQPIPPQSTEPVKSMPNNTQSSELMVKPETPQVTNNSSKGESKVVTKAEVQPKERTTSKKEEEQARPALVKPQNKQIKRTQETPKAKPKDQSKQSSVSKTTKQNVTQAKSIQASSALPQKSQEDLVALQRLQSQVSNLLVQEIKRKLRYPRNAIRRKLEGVVQVEFNVSKGKISSFRLSKSSGHKILDDAAKKLAQGMVNMSLPVNNQDTVVVVPIKYELL